MTSSAVAPEHTIWPPTASDRRRAARLTARPEVVAVAELGLPGVHCHADAQGLPQRPRLVDDRFLQFDSGGRGGRRPFEDREGGVALASRLDQPPTA